MAILKREQMDGIYDILIVGGGLAGATAALHLSRTRHVLLLEADEPASGASGAAAGLVNPLMTRRARAIWQAEEALDALHETVELASADATFDASGVLRPAHDAGQADDFQEAATRHPALGTWLPPAAVAERFPAVPAPQGALHVHAGAAIDVPAYVRALLAASQDQGAVVQPQTPVHRWGESGDTAWVETEMGQRLHARCVLLTMGYGGLTHPALDRLHLHGIKGQTVRVQRPAGLGALPNLSGRGYIVPDGDTLIVGSSYEHTFADLRPSPEQTRRILQRAAQMLPGLAGAAVLDATAGVRVTVPRTRLPMLGPLPGCTRCWIFSGLSSKGLLMAPLLARHLAVWLDHPDRLPSAIRVSLKPA